MAKKKKRKYRLYGGLRRMPLLHVFDDLARRYPDVLLRDLTKPQEGYFSVEDIHSGILEQYQDPEFQETLHPGLLDYLSGPYFFWDVDETGYVNVYERDPETGRFTKIFEQPRIDMPVAQAR